MCVKIGKCARCCDTKDRKIYEIQDNYEEIAIDLCLQESIENIEFIVMISRTSLQIVIKLREY